MSRQLSSQQLRVSRDRKMMWDATSRTDIFYLSILQVNQIHIGDAVEVRE